MDNNYVVFAFDFFSAIGEAIMSGNTFVGLEVSKNHVSVIGDLDSEELSGNNLSFGKIPFLEINDPVKYKVEPDKIAPIAFTFDQICTIASALQCYSDKVSDGLSSGTCIEKQTLSRIQSNISEIQNVVEDLFQNFGVVSESVQL